MRLTSLRLRPASTCAGLWLRLVSGSVSCPRSARARRAVAGLVTLAAWVGICAPAWAEYRTVETEGLRITFDSDWPGDTAAGYLPIRLEIANVNDAREIEIVGMSRRFHYGVRGRGGGGSSLVTVRRSVRLARGGRVAFTMPMPIGSDNESIQFEVREDGRLLEQLGGGNTRGALAGNAAAAVIIVQPGSSLADAAAGWRRAATGAVVTTFPPGPGGGPVKDFVLEPVRAPTDWLGWTSTSAVFVGGNEWRQLSDAQRAALRTWVASGGDLGLVDGTLSSLFPNERPPELRASGDGADYFLGRIHLLTASSISSQGFEHVLAAIDKTPIDAGLALPVSRTADWARIEGRGFRLLIPGVDGVPTRAYLTILLLFSVLIGPVNYVFLKRRRLQVLFVLTAPIIAAVFIALLAGYVVVGDGFGVRGRAVTFTRLDQDRRQAATRATASLYAGMTPSGGLDFPSDVAVFPLGSDGGIARTELRFDLTDSQRLTSGAIRARVASNIETVGFRTARERLGFDRQGDRVSVVNGLGQTVARLVLRDQGRFYRLTTPLAPGSRAVMEVGNLSPAALLNNDLTAMSRFRGVTARQPDGSYLARLEHSPFWEAGAADVEERGSVHLVLGTGALRP